MKMTREKIFDLDYPQNLLRAVFTDYALEKEEKDGLENLEPRLVPADQAGTLEYVMSTTLLERECQVLHMRYGCKMTLEECAECFGVGRERIRQIEAKAIRKLRHPSRARLIMKGLAFWREQEKRGIENANFEKGRLVGYNKGRLNGYIQAIKDYDMQMEYNSIRSSMDERKEAEEREKMTNVVCQPIEIMDLTVRSFNCLKRANINTVGDTLKNIEMIRAGKIRNLGKKSIEEVEMRLRGLGAL